MNLIAVILFLGTAYAQMPTRYTELLDFVQEAPDQGDTGTCLYMASTGAVELLLNKKYQIRHPKQGDLFDISERFTVVNPVNHKGTWHLKGLTKLNEGEFIHHDVLPFQAKTSSGKKNKAVWRRPSGFNQLPRVTIEERFKAQKLFIKGRNRWSRYVTNANDLKRVKEMLTQYQSPVMVNYKHKGYWHVVNIVGYDDEAQGECLYTPSSECKSSGGFYVRDSIGRETHLRSYDWFRVNVNAAFSIQLK